MCYFWHTSWVIREVIWDSTARETVRSFSPEVKKELGALLLILQNGAILGMPQSRKIPTVHRSAFELKARDKNGIYRVFYVLFDGDKILIPHAFTKKTQKTPDREIKIAKQRLRRLLEN